MMLFFSWFLEAGMSRSRLKIGDCLLQESGQRYNNFLRYLEQGNQCANLKRTFLAIRRCKECPAQPERRYVWRPARGRILVFPKFFANTRGLKHGAYSTQKMIGYSDYEISMNSEWSRAISISILRQERNEYRDRCFQIATENSG